MIYILLLSHFLVNLSKCSFLNTDEHALTQLSFST